MRSENRVTPKAFTNSAQGKARSATPWVKGLVVFPTLKALNNICSPFQGCEFVWDWCPRVSRCALYPGLKFANAFGVTRSARLLLSAWLN
jgi:hypothetical protein